MNMRISHFLTLLGLCITLLARAQGAPQSGGDFSSNPQPKKLPTETILVNGAWSSASDSVTPLREGGKGANNVYTNQYFGLTYVLSPDWTEKYSGPPPSDSGYYVLAQIRPADTFKGTIRGSVLIAAQDLFFSLTPASNTLELINFSKDSLNVDYKVEQPPTAVRIANHSLIRFDYGSPVAELHWHVLATQIRCHMVQFVFTGRDTKLMERLMQDMNKMSLPDEAGSLLGRGGGGIPFFVSDDPKGENQKGKKNSRLSSALFTPLSLPLPLPQ